VRCEEVTYDGAEHCFFSLSGDGGVKGGTWWRLDLGSRWTVEVSNFRKG